MEQYQNKVQLDTRGLFCPEPVFRTKTAMDKLAVGEVLELWADDPAAEEDISRWAKRTGNEVLSIRKEGRDLIFLIKRK
ncbi:MAG: sulfurtransferase TusA family protein [Thaumarchaeota archaeon]|nr:sulfurtransferase TusA family protein [Nitrososphaerota archaeon]